MKPIKMANCLGVNNRLSDFDLRVATSQLNGQYLGTGMNVEVDDAGNIVRRPGTVVVQSLSNAHSLHLISDTSGYMAVGAVLYSITLPTYTQTPLKALSTSDAISYVDTPVGTFYSNGTDRGRIYNGVVYTMGLPLAAEPSASVISGGLLAGWYQVAVSFSNSATGEEGGVSPSYNVQVSDNSGLRVTLPTSQVGATHVNVYLSSANGETVYFVTSVAIGTATLDLTNLTAQSQGRAASENYEDALPAGRLFMANNRLCSIVGPRIYIGMPYKFGYYIPISGYIDFDSDVAVAVCNQTGVYVATGTTTHWIPGDIGNVNDMIRDVFPFGAAAGSEFSFDNQTVVGWFSDKGFVVGDAQGVVDAPMDPNIVITPVNSGKSFVLDMGGYRRVIGCGWTMNLASKAATTQDINFTSASRGYVTTSIGLCRLDETGGSAAAFIDYGKIDFGVDTKKHLPAAYISVTCDESMVLGVDDGDIVYSYESEPIDSDLELSRFEVGKGLRSNWFDINLSNQDGLYFKLAFISFTPSFTSRRVK